MANSPCGQTQDRSPNVSKAKPNIIGIYGLPGVGKSRVLSFLRQNLDSFQFSLFDGSHQLRALVDLDKFKGLDSREKIELRQRATSSIVQTCSAADSPTTGIVAGHYMFWDECGGGQDVAWTQADEEAYTHILYLDIDPGVLEQQIADDKERDRPRHSTIHLQEWQKREKRELRELCGAHEIEFVVLQGGTQKIARQVCNFIRHLTADDEHSNQVHMTAALSSVLALPSFPSSDHVFVFDGDRTIAPQDSSKLFWKEVSPGHYPLKPLFDGSGYSYSAFRQAVLLYEELDKEEFDSVCEAVASKIQVSSEFLDLIASVKRSGCSSALIVTAGLQTIWDRVLRFAQISDTVKVIGASLSPRRAVVTPGTKRTVVAQLQASGRYVTAFGDSPLDLPMLCKADRGILVVGEEDARSQAMDVALEKVVNMRDVQLHQVLLPNTVKPRLDTYRLPVITIPDLHPLQIVIAAHSSPSAASLLTTPTRDARISGPALRKCHQQIGWYLSVGYLSSLLGLETTPIPHVLGHDVDGQQIRSEANTLIVPLMRGGEPMALGISEALPLAAFLHAKEHTDITPAHLRQMTTVILVDSVINTGRAIEKFVTHLRALDGAIRIVIVANVVQEAVLQAGGKLRELGMRGRLSLIALRTSPRSFTGIGTTDTGHRLFNTTWLEEKKEKERVWGGESGQDDREQNGPRHEESKEARGEESQHPDEIRSRTTAAGIVKILDSNDTGYVVTR